MIKGSWGSMPVGLGKLAALVAAAGFDEEALSARRLSYGWRALLLSSLFFGSSLCCAAEGAEDDEDDKGDEGAAVAMTLDPRVEGRENEGGEPAEVVDEGGAGGGASGVPPPLRWFMYMKPSMKV
jgi:hypothetical protein